MKPNEILDTLNDVDLNFVKVSEQEPVKGKNRNGKIVSRITALSAALDVIIGKETVIARCDVNEPRPFTIATEMKQPSDPNGISVITIDHRAVGTE